MKKQVFKSLLIAAVATSISACSKEDDSKGGVKVRPAAQPTQPGQQMPEVEKDKQGAPIRPQLEKDLKKDDGDLERDNDSTKKGEKSDTSSATVKVKPARVVEPKGLAKNYANASDDVLVELIAKKMDKMATTDAQRKANIVAAEMIENVETKISATADIILDLTLKENDKAVVYSLAGILNGDLNANLKATAAGGKKKMTAKLTCLDVDQSMCFVSLIKLDIVNEDKTSTQVSIVVRKTYTNYYWEKPATTSNLTKSALDLVSLLEDSELRKAGKAKIISMVMDSFEVVNGRSAMSAAIVADNNEVIALSGALLLSEGPTRNTSNVLLKQEIRERQISGILNPGKIRKNLSAGIRSAKLVSIEAGTRYSIVLDLATTSGQNEKMLLRLDRMNVDTDYSSFEE